jgi:hypothetical protein
MLKGIVIFVLWILQAREVGYESASQSARAQRLLRSALIYSLLQHLLLAYSSLRTTCLVSGLMLVFCSKTWKHAIVPTIRRQLVIHCVKYPILYSFVIHLYSASQKYIRIVCIVLEWVEIVTDTIMFGWGSTPAEVHTDDAFIEFPPSLAGGLVVFDFDMDDDDDDNNDDGGVVGEKNNTKAKHKDQLKNEATDADEDKENEVEDKENEVEDKENEVEDQENEVKEEEEEEDQEMKTLNEFIRLLEREVEE